jgi:hypothetical protein
LPLSKNACLVLMSRERVSAAIRKRKVKKRPFILNALLAL